METLQSYQVAPEDALFSAFMEGRPLPYSTESSAWLRRITDYTGSGRRMSRVHVVDEPLTDYLRFELEVYRINQSAGEEVFITPRRTHVALASFNQDWYLFDDETLIFMHYSESGEFLGAAEAPEGTDVGIFRRQRDLALEHAIPLGRYLNRGWEYRSA
jgi:hypothetical protein